MAHPKFNSKTPEPPLITEDGRLAIQEVEPTFAVCSLLRVNPCLKRCAGSSEDSDRGFLLQGSQESGPFLSFEPVDFGMNLTF